MGNITFEELVNRYKNEQVFFTSSEMVIDVNSRDVSGDSLLHIASIRGILEEAALLIENGADVNGTGEMSYTPLHYAVNYKHMDVIQLLLQNGADATIKNDFGKTACDTQNVEIKKLLQKFCQK
jgi:hypothetical protein